MSLILTPHPTASCAKRAMSKDGIQIRGKYIAVGKGLQTIKFDDAGMATTDTLADLVGFVEILKAKQVSPYQWQFAVDIKRVPIAEEWDFSEFAFWDENKNSIAIYGNPTKKIFSITPALDHALLGINLVLGTFRADSITIEHHNLPLELFNDDLAATILRNSLQIEKDNKASIELYHQLKKDTSNEIGTLKNKVTQTNIDLNEQKSENLKKNNTLEQNMQLLIYSSWSQFDYLTEINRMQWGSGITHARGYEYGGGRAYHLPTSTGYSPYNGHDHGNIENLVGTGEFGVMVNGIYCRTRHNDDGLWMPCKAGDDYDNRQMIKPPSEPADIASASSPEEKSRIAENYIRIMAGQLPQNAVDDYANSARWVMTGIELYPEVYQHGQSLRDPFPGHRHQINVDTLPELFKQETFYAAGGHKNIRENSLHIAMAINDVDDEGKPVIVLWRYRFISAPVGSLADYPIDDLLEYHEDRANHARWEYDKEQMLKSRLARFRIKQSLGKDISDSQWNKPELIDELISNIAGLDGYGNTLDEEYHYYGANDKLKKYGTDEPLNAGYYSRWYTMSGNDASNRRNAKRGFSDDKLWVARTTNPRIKQTKFGDEKYGFSYFVPLELHLQSFLNGNFNPYGIKDVSSEYSRQEFKNLVDQGYGKTQDKPLAGHNNFFYFYKNPADIFDGQSPSDPADTTVAGGLWITCADGVARKHLPSGYRYFLPTQKLLGSLLRTRYPIYFAAYEGTDAHKYLEAEREHTRIDTQVNAAGVIKNAIALAKLHNTIGQIK